MSYSASKWMKDYQGMMAFRGDREEHLETFIVFFEMLTEMCGVSEDKKHLSLQVMI